MRKVRNAIMVSLAFVVLLGTVVLTAHVVEDDERAILLNNDEFVRVVKPGIVWLIPKTERLDRVSLSPVSLRRQRILTDADQRSAKVDLLVTFHHDPEQTYEIYRRYGSDDAYAVNVKGMCFDKRVIQTRHREVSRRVDDLAESMFAQYTESNFEDDTRLNLIHDRDALNSALEHAIKEALADEPIIVDKLQIEKIDYTRE